ncbi:hypothetical protein F5Y03DRAFT_348654 [Xylaria venustula]|nr:hypothetical protein F5Y03DRAFT_348654 [Xylaria venustula]
MCDSWLCYCSIFHSYAILLLPPVHTFMNHLVLLYMLVLRCIACLSYLAFYSNQVLPALFTIFPFLSGLHPVDLVCSTNKGHAHARYTQPYSTTAHPALPLARATCSPPQVSTQ